MSLKIRQQPNALVVQPSRKRQTPPPRVTFRKVMEGGAQILAAGARVATRIVGGPFLAASLAGTEGLVPSTADPLDANSGSTQNPLDALRSDGMNDDLKLLALQERIQRNNRQFVLVSNVMKARHETAKSAITNIRA